MSDAGLPGSCAALPLRRTRLAVLLISAAAIALQLVLMRILALQFWGHLAYLVIGVALLGFGASGTILTLLRGPVAKNPRRWLAAAALLLALSLPLVPRIAGILPVHVAFLAWDLGRTLGILGLQLVFLLPFLLAGGAIGVVLMDRGRRLGGHYAANLVGSGLGALAVVPAMAVLGTGALLNVLAAVALFAGAAIVPPTRRGLACLTLTAAATVVIAAVWPWRPALSEFKALPQLLDLPGSEVLHRSEGPLGRLDVVAGPAVRHAPGLSLGYLDDLPPHAVILLDGETLGAVHRIDDPAGWRFMDHTTGAAAYHLWPAGGAAATGRRSPSALVVGAGGGAEIGLALHHDALEVTALEMNPQLVALMTGPLRERGGGIYAADRVTVLPREARGYLGTTRRTFDVIQVPALDAFGATGAGLHAAQESYLYTVEAFGEMIDRLAPGGVLGVTRWARTPPRDELRALAIAAEALRRGGREPREHLAMLRNWATATVLVVERSLAEGQVEALRSFCAQRGFDLCFLPGLARKEANRFHVLERPAYYEAAAALLGPDRDRFIADYLFDIAPATDDRPYFFRSLRWSTLPELGRRLGDQGRAFLELGSLLTAAALLQGLAIGLALILLPLLPLRRGLRGVPRRLPALVYFLMLGGGFMLLEIGFLQKLILYLAHPIHAASAVIAAFLVGGGLGSLSTSGRTPRPRSLALGALAVAALGLLYVLTIDDWLALSRGRPLSWRLAIACATIAPLAFAMGRLMPAGLALVGRDRAALVPWAWAVNGFASVAATLAAPLIAAGSGFGAVLLLAVGCYLLAAAGALRLR